MKTKKEKEFEAALRKIALLGNGIKEEVRDWGAIGRNALMTARDALTETCQTCGQKKGFKPWVGD